MNIVFALALALVAGMLLPLQAGMNNPLKLAFGSALLPACVTFSVGALSLWLVALASRSLAGGELVAKVPWWSWIGGGLCGALFVTLMIAMASRLGGAVTFALIVAGEMLMSMVLDHFGWLGFASHAAGPGRLAGAALLVLGVILIQRF